jgi:hypothetical protein
MPLPLGTQAGAFEVRNLQADNATVFNGKDGITRNKDSSLRSSGRKSGKGEKLLGDEWFDGVPFFLKSGGANQDVWKSRRRGGYSTLAFPRLAQGASSAL